MKAGYCALPLRGAEFRAAVNANPQVNPHGAACPIRILHVQTVFAGDSRKLFNNVVMRATRLFRRFRGLCGRFDFETTGADAIKAASKAACALKARARKSSCVS